MFEDNITEIFSPPPQGSVSHAPIVFTRPYNPFNQFGGTTSLPMKIPNPFETRFLPVLKPHPLYRRYIVCHTQYQNNSL